MRSDAQAEPPETQPAGPVTDPEHQLLFSRLLTHLPQGVLVVDRSLRIVYANPAARRLVGVGGTRPGEPLPEPWEQYSLRGLAESLFSRRPKVGEQLVDTGDAVYSIEGLTAAGLPTATLLLDDVTERERNRQMERRFVENAAHELRTPLAAIASVVDVLESGAKNDPATRDSFLKHLRTHSDRLTRLATSLLVLARIQSGQEQPRLDIVRVAPLLEEVSGRLLPKGGVSVVVDAPPDLAVLADPDLLAHALENIGANAVEHTRSGSIVFEARAGRGKAEIEVSDTGVGMIHEDSVQAFHRFYRGGGGDDGEGFGLGLAIAKEAVRALDGTVHIDSTPDVGTRVQVTLPSAKVLP